MNCRAAEMLEVASGRKSRLARVWARRNEKTLGKILDILK